MNKRPRLVDGFHRSSDDDNSSSGCSSSGPGGLRNLIPSPVPPHGRSMTMSYYGQSSPIEEPQQHQLQRQLPRNGMLSSSRYLPYSIRPLVVRAKRKLQNDSDVHVTSTARRIINALDNVATPVVNSVKIPFKPIISSHPVYTPLRRDTQGPPIMKSPLIPSPQGKIVYNPAMHLHIPRMVDFGTNTDLNMSAFNNNADFLHLQQQPSIGVSMSSQDDYNSRGASGGKMKSSYSSRMHAAPIKPVHMSAKTVSFSTPESFAFTNSNIESQYEFSEPWSVEDVSKHASKDKKQRSGDSNNDSFGKTVIKQQTPVPRKWICEKCKLGHDSTVSKCPCETKNEEETLKPLSSFVVPSGLGTNKWRCKECYVDNDSDAPACVCCGEKNPSPPISLPKAAAKNWTCNGCWTSNKPDASECPCCGEKNPDGASSTATAPDSVPVPASTFSFGFGAPPASSKTAAEQSTPKSSASTASSTFAFGSPKDSSTPKSTFTFGVKAETPTSSTKGSPAPTSSFTFGADKKTAETPKPVVTSTPEPPKPFGGFTLPTSSSTPKTSTPISFGVPAEPSAATAVKSSPSFGLPGRTPDAVISPKAAIPITAIDKTQPSTNPFASFSFGGAKPTSTSGINSLPGVVKEDSEYWRCNNCPARTRVSSNQCIGCAGPKPPAVSSKGKAAGGKRFHFEPFFGGRPEDKGTSEVNDYSEPEPELKRKIPSSSSHNSSSSSSSLGFMYTPPTESTLKYKSPESSMPVTSTQPSEMKQGSFLDALGSGSQFKFQSPSPGASIIPSGPSSTVSSSTSSLNNLIKTDPSALPTSSSSSLITAPVVSSSSNSLSSGGGMPSLSSTTGGGPPSGLFQFGATPASSTPSNSMTSPMSMNNNNLTQSTFTFGGGGGGGLKNGPLSSSSSPAPSIFGSSLSSSSLLTGGAGAPSTVSSVFGSPVPVTPSPMLPPAQQSTISSPTSSVPPSAQQQFNLTPNFNFGGPLTAPGPGSFVFQARPTGGAGGPPGDGGMGQRKIRRATRRIR